MIKLRVVIKESTSRDDINRLAWKKNWIFHDLMPRSEKSPYEKIWLTPDEKTAIHYIEDDLIDIPYLLIEGENQEKLVSEIEFSIGTYNLPELHEMLQKATNRDEYIRSIYRIGAAINQEYNPELFKDFQTLMYHPEVDVRKAAIFATTYVGWVEFKEPLQQLRTSDPEPSVRNFADCTLESLTKHYWQKNAD
jgi:hypothetical protein